MPYHYFLTDGWGIVILFEGVLWLASEIVRSARGRIAAIDAVRAARMFLYHHQHYHHRTECFALRMEITHRQAFYITSLQAMVATASADDDLLEEGLANARALTETERFFARNPRVIGSLEDYVSDCPPGHNRGVELRHDMMSRQCELAERYQFACLPGLGMRNPEIWRAAGNMFSGTANVKGRTSYVILKDSSLADRLGLGG